MYSHYFCAKLPAQLVCRNSKMAAYQNFWSDQRKRRISWWLKTGSWMDYWVVYGGYSDGVGWLEGYYGNIGKHDSFWRLQEFSCKKWVGWKY
ncbi:hypothetical protein HanPI659440_Chr13g0499521 [Helianthus annuus]|nr:hypothetical protein HanPI659440_Chr13g0499521 [Helianthus annuus]